MKTILFAAVLAAFSFTACQKEDANLITSTPVTGIDQPVNIKLPTLAEKWIVDHYPEYVIGKTTVERTKEEKFYRVSIKRDAPNEDVKTIVFDADSNIISIF